jgi:hypothetical protein
MSFDGFSEHPAIWVDIYSNGKQGISGRYIPVDEFAEMDAIGQHVGHALQTHIHDLSMWEEFLGGLLLHMDTALAIELGNKLVHPGRRQSKTEDVT